MSARVYIDPREYPDMGIVEQMRMLCTAFRMRNGRNASLVSVGYREYTYIEENIFKYATSATLDTSRVWGMRLVVKDVMTHLEVSDDD